ncbi:MAG TPA: TonB-dependent receptor [Steroidobacteraceae bacterium]
MNNYIGLLPIASCALIICGSERAEAQSVSEPAGLEEIVVTAEKVPSTLQKTAAAIIAISGNDLVAQNITDVTDLGAAVPGLQVSQTIVSTVIMLRGVGQTISADNTQPGVAMLFNGVYVPREMTLASFYDLTSVEAVPGPQGTLYGRNAAGGIISVTTNKPTGQFEGSALVEGGNYSDLHTTDVLNLPVNDVLWLRGAIDYHRHDGYLSNGLDDLEQTSGRLSVLLQPNDAFSLYVSGTAYAITGNGPAVGIVVPVPHVSLYTPRPSDPWYDGGPTNGLSANLRGQYLSAEATYRFDGATLTYLPGYMNYNYNSETQDGSVNISAEPVKSHILSQELRLASDSTGRSQWLAAAYWTNSDETEAAHLALPASLGGAAISSGLDSQQESYAVFGRYSYAILDNLRLIAGARYSWDKLEGNVLETLPGGVHASYGGAPKDDRFDWKAGIEVDVAPHSMLYANVQTGYLQGGFTQVPPGSGLSSLFAPETLIGYVVGIKNRFFDNRLQVNDEAFYYDYKDFQVSYVQTPVTVTSDAPKSAIYGDQLDIDFLLTDSTEIFLNATALHAAFTQFQDPVAPFTNFKGYQMQFAPSLSGSVGLQQNWSLGHFGTLTGRVQTYYNSGFWSTYQHTPGTQQGSYTKTDLAMTYTTLSKTWSVAAFVNNAENSAVYTAAGTSAVGEVIAPIAPPRTFGLRLMAHFK